MVKNLPLFPDCAGAKALNAAFEVVAPVPPLSIAIVPAFQVPVVTVPKIEIVF